MSEGALVVVGTGAMAPEIAAAGARAGMTARIAGRSLARARDAARRALELGGGAEASEIGPGAFADAGLVIETVVEDLETKRELLGRVEAWCPPEAVIATNTSSLRVAEIAAPLAHPERFGGLHFLKPAHLTAVVEVIPGPATSESTVAALRSVAERMGKTPLVVRADVPGFIWNRIQFAVLRECLHLLDAGVADAADIDAAVSDGLAPRWMAAGPLATADLGGLATFAVIARELFPHLAGGPAVSAELTDRAAAGRPLAEWTRAGGPAIDDLRAQALAHGREIAARRRTLGA